jgi:hypothetical protein
MSRARQWYVVRTLTVEHGITYREYMSPEGSYTRTSPCGHPPVPGLTWLEAQMLLETITTQPDWRRFTRPYLHNVPPLGDSHA